jgi:hypothetical protein
LIADLFHSIFETWHFHHSAFPIEQRQVIRDLIGKETEFLAYAFCVTGRPLAFLVHAGLPDIALKDHHPGGMIRLSSAALNSLLEIEAANLLEQGGNVRGALEARSVLASAPSQKRASSPAWSAGRYRASARGSPRMKRQARTSTSTGG